MTNILDFITGEKKGLRWFLCGALFGTAGIGILKSADARKVYVQGTAAALRGKEEIMTTATTLRENCEDIYAEAQEINEKRAAAKESEEVVIEDTAANPA